MYQFEYTVLPLLYLLCIWWNKAVKKDVYQFVSEALTGQVTNLSGCMCYCHWNLQFDIKSNWRLKLKFNLKDGF